MKILFLHNNFPAQFVHLAGYFSSMDSGEVVFISEFTRQGVTLPRVRHIKVGPIPAPDTKIEPQKVLLINYLRGQYYGKAMKKLHDEGWYPDLIIEHAGWGCATCAADIFPKAVRVSYLEWFYNKGEYFNFFSKNHPRNPNEFITSRQRNLCQLDALQECHIGIAPTFWQYSQYPHEYVHKMHILHEGIDTNYFTPSETGSNSVQTINGLDISGMKEIVTYTARGLEPTRGFPQLYKMLPSLLEQRPDCHVVIMANDSSYYDTPRADGKAWGHFLRNKFPIDENRVHFLPYGSLEEYRNLLRVSNVHVYLTAPFVLSWSMLEAMSCGCLVVASNTQPVREVIRHMQNGLLTSFWDTNEMSKTISQALQDKSKLNEIRENARKTVCERFDSLKSVNQFVHMLSRHMR